MRFVGVGVVDSVWGCARYFLGVGEVCGCGCGR